MKRIYTLTAILLGMMLCFTGCTEDETLQEFENTEFVDPYLDGSGGHTGGGGQGGTPPPPGDS